MGEGTNAARYRAALERFNEGDLDGYLDFYSDDVVFGGISPEPMDKAATTAFHRYFLSAFPGTRSEFADLLEIDDRIAARLVLHVVHEGEFLGAQPTGRRAVMGITTILTMRDGKCVERWSTADIYGLLVQLGAIQAQG